MDEAEDAAGVVVRVAAPRRCDVRVEGLDRAEMGHSAETLHLTVSWVDATASTGRTSSSGCGPRHPACWSPTTCSASSTILRALEPTPVRAPRPLWFEPSGEVLGREFYVMERLPGDGLRAGRSRRSSPPTLGASGGCASSMVEQIAAIHTVDLRATGLDAIGDGRGYLDRELEHWSRRDSSGSNAARSRRSSGWSAALRENCSRSSARRSRSSTATPKPGNFAFEGAEVTAVFDWEMATVGDPLADIGWAEVLWALPGYFTTLPGALCRRGARRPVGGAHRHHVPASRRGTAPSSGSRWR